jgi:hypothetical protein
MGPRAAFAIGLPRTMSKMTQEVTNNGTYCLQVSCVSAIKIVLCASGKDFKEELETGVILLVVILAAGEYLANTCLGMAWIGGEKAVVLAMRIHSIKCFIINGFVWLTQ